MDIDKIQAARIRFFDPEYHLLGELLRYKSMQFHRKWRTYGVFEIHISAYAFADKTGRKKRNRLFCIENYIMLDNDPYRAGVITYIQYTRDEIIIKGFELLWILTNRITIPPPGKDEDVYNTNVEDIVIGLTARNAVSADKVNRNFEDLKTTQSKGKGDKINFSSRLKVLAYEIESLCETSGLGCVIGFYPKEKCLKLEVLVGVDVSYDNGINAPYVFSNEFKRVYDRVYTTSIQDYKTCAAVAGQGEGADRTILWVNDDAKGHMRKEIYVDARDIGEDSNITLSDRGKLKLSECPKTVTYECSVIEKDYRTKWDLGWFATISDKEWGIKENHQVTEVLEVYEGGAFKPKPIFGKTIKKIGDSMRRMKTKIEASGKAGKDGKTPTFRINEIGHLEAILPD